MLAAWCACAALALAAGVTTEESAARALTGASRWAVASTVLLGDADAPGAELGYRLAAALTLRAQPDPHARGLLLHFTLESPQLMLRGKHRNAEFLPKPSLWDSMPSSEFLAVWSEGHITDAYLDPGDPPDVLDYKKALISLFQFQVEAGERNETDVSGDCRVHYDAVSELVFRKSKVSCSLTLTTSHELLLLITLIESVILLYKETEKLYLRNEKIYLFILNTWKTNSVIHISTNYNRIT